MGLRELKEAAHQQFVRGKFAQCAQTYQQILRLAPKDPTMRMRHAEACRRAGDAPQAIASYRAAAALLLELRCESRARGALKAALELDPKDPQLLAEVARLGPQQDEPLELEAPVAVQPQARPSQAPLPPIHRALPAVRPATAAPAMRPVGTPPPVLPTAMASALPPRTGAMNQPVQGRRSAAPPVLQPRESFSGTMLPAQRNVLAPPPQSHTELIGATQEAPVFQFAPTAPGPAKDSGAKLEVRRLSPSALAFRSSQSGTWAVIRSSAPIEMHLVNSLEQLPPLPRDAAESQAQPTSEQASLH